ncbi:MAG: MutH/Sau3AI family endonuclease [Actinomycetes bacterium]
MSYDATDPESIERYARRLVDRPIGDLLPVQAGERQGTYTKGHVGQHYERYFGLSVNSEQRPDFEDCGVELKAVPIAGSGKNQRAKERTFVTAIDYATIAQQPFEGSALDLKTRHSLFVFYEWRPDVDAASFRTLAVVRHERDELDELIVREAYDHVRRRVREGRAHELSEGDTYALGAATKDSRARDIPQPYSTLPARRRAFAWKPDYTTRLWQASRLRGGVPTVTAPDRMTELEELLESRLDAWRGESVRGIRDRLAPGLSDSFKAIASNVTRRVLSASDGTKVEEVDRLGITLRTIRVHPETALPYESVSFPAFLPVELANEEWDGSRLESQLRAMFFVVLEAWPDDDVVDARLRGGFFWHPTPKQIATAASEWEVFRRHLAESRPDRMPTPSETRILHVRPHGRDSTDRVPLPDGTPWQRSSFWLNREFVGRLVAEHL